MGGKRVGGGCESERCFREIGRWLSTNKWSKGKKGKEPPISLLLREKEIFPLRRQNSDWLTDWLQFGILSLLLLLASVVFRFSCHVRVWGSSVTPIRFVSLRTIMVHVFERNGLYFQPNSWMSAVSAGDTAQNTGTFFAVFVECMFNAYLLLY